MARMKIPVSNFVPEACTSLQLGSVNPISLELLKDAALPRGSDQKVC